LIRKQPNWTELESFSAIANVSDVKSVSPKLFSYDEIRVGHYAAVPYVRDLSRPFLAPMVEENGGSAAVKSQPIRI